ncbi:hypothetical protein WISP_02127 [Willisornis vidua]|uniref:Uncharacterized protein n=1 Tax=Willisornis vidua TaxID=1566151 RepID=A0ABQ9DYS8_9PASS|nr:hypothetical protein WISP_02127 [Willisornis vidua]
MTSKSFELRLGILEVLKMNWIYALGVDLSRSMEEGQTLSSEISRHLWLEAGRKKREWSFTEDSWLKLMVSVCQSRVEWDPRMVIDLVFYGKGCLLGFISSEDSKIIDKYVDQNGHRTSPTISPLHDDK